MTNVRNILLPSLVGAFALSLGGCAPTASPQAGNDAAAARQCFFVQSVRSFASEDDRTVYVRTGSQEVFALSTIGCLNVDWSQRIGIETSGGRASSICSGFDAELIVPDLSGGGTQRCPVTDVRRLTEAEVAALTPEQRP